MKLEETTTDVTTAFDWDKVYQLPLLHSEDGSNIFLFLVAEAKQKPLGVVWVDYRKWKVIFKYSREIKYIYKYIEEWEDYSEKEQRELYESLSTQEKVYYDLLVEENKKESREA